LRLVETKTFLYLKELDNKEKAAKARGTHIRVHFKHCREIGHAIKGLKLSKAKSYLENVLLYKEAIPYTKYTGGIGRHAIGKRYKAPGDKVSWPQKATKSFLDLLRNIESNAETKGLEMDKVTITHVNCNQAPKMRRRTYRAHGRINAYMSSPAHIQLIVEEINQGIVKEKNTEDTKDKQVPEENDQEKKVASVRYTKKQIAKLRLKKVKVGGGV